jgi:ABC-type Fe3+/spermidine/putrescine transport system ATPase subunit
VSLLEVQGICKSYPDGWTMSGVRFAVERGEDVCLLGPSGCGKTTLLRLIAGLERPDAGRIVLNGKDVTELPPHLRGLGLMFQEYALFPHKDVFGNVVFGLRMRGREREAARRVSEVLELVGLAGFEHRDVNQLSGGERQRVALARSLAPRPELIMLDEPLGALDRSMRERLMGELPRILRQDGATAITVTHDQEEAFAIADRIVLMREGRVVQVGTPETVHARPASAWAAHFLGLTNLLDARVTRPGEVDTAIGALALDDLGQHSLQAGAKVTLLIRPEAARLDSHGANVMRARVVERSFRGEYQRLSVRHERGVALTFNFAVGARLPEAGEMVALRLDPQALVALPAE